MGTVSLLKTRETIKPKSQSQSPSSSSSKKPSVWSIDEDDAIADLPMTDDVWSADQSNKNDVVNIDDMVDEDSLLEEEDKAISTYVPISGDKDDCDFQGGNKRGACKNCSCGRAEELKQGAALADVKSSCGNVLIYSSFIF